MNKINLVLIAMFISFSSCQKDAESINEEAQLKQGYWQLLSIVETSSYESFVDDILDSTYTSVTLDTTLSSGSLVLDFDFDSLRIYENGFYAASHKWMIDENELVFYGFNYTDENGDTVNYYNEFTIDLLNTNDFQFTEFSLDTMYNQGSIIYQEVNVVYVLENISTFEPMQNFDKFSRSNVSLFYANEY
jgi:hypothetical protein